MNEQQLPQAFEAEQCIFGAVMRDKTAYARAAAIVSKRDFTTQQHKETWQAMTDLAAEDKPHDITTVANKIGGGRSWLVDCCGMVATGGQVESHAEIVREKSRLRSLILSLQGFTKDAFGDKPSEELAESIVRQMLSVGDDEQKANVVKLGDLFPGALADAELIQKGEKKYGVPSGFTEIDKYLGGFADSDLIIIAGRPSMGKTAIMDNMAMDMSVNQGVPILFFQAETAAKPFALRAMSSHSGVNSQKLRKGTLDDADWDALTKSSNEIAGKPYYLDPRNEIDIHALTITAENYVRRHGVKCIFVDFIQKLTSRQRFSGGEEEVSYYARTLKRLSSRLEVPVIVGSQLSRKVEERKNKRPLLSDLKWSGKIEEESDVIIGLYRPEWYASEKDKNSGRYAGVAEAIILKHRNGPIGTANLFFNKDVTRFEDAGATFGMGQPEMSFT